MHTTTGMKKPNLFIEVTLHEILDGMKAEYNRIRVEKGGRAPSSTEVTKAYDGTKKNKYLKLPSAAAARLDVSVINLIGDIMQSEHADILSKHA